MLLNEVREIDTMSTLLNYTKIMKLSINKSLILSACLFISACGVLHQQNIVQGQTITAESVDQLELGMDQEQVRVVLGSPSLVDTFDSSQWIYFFSEAGINKNKLSKQGNIRLFFEQRKLDKIVRNGFVVVENDDANLTGGTIITEPTQKKRGIFNR